MTDTLKVLLEDKFVSAFTNDSSTLSSTYITVIGMLLVAFLTIVSQYIITTKTIRADFEKIKAQISSDFDYRSRHEWISDFRRIIAELITTTDPDIKKEIDRVRLFSLINQAQIMLSNNVKEEGELEGLITKLGMQVVTYRASDTEILQTQDVVLKKTKEVLHKKQFVR